MCAVGVCMMLAGLHTCISNLRIIRRFCPCGKIFGIKQQKCGEKCGKMQNLRNYLQEIADLDQIPKFVASVESRFPEGTES